MTRPAPWAAVVAVCLAACVRDKPKAEAPPEPSSFEAKGNPVVFAFEDVEGKPLTADSLRGRVTVIGFVTTYDFASQAEARFLSSLVRHHVPRVNVALLVLEAPENQPLARAFARSLELPYQVALADGATIAGQGPFAGLHHVPSVVMLDTTGREVYRHVGLIEAPQMERILHQIQGR